MISEQSESRGHHNTVNPCLSLVSSDRILTYWKLRKIFPSRSDKNDLNLSKLIASIREISILMLNTKDCLPTIKCVELCLDMKKVQIDET